MSQVESRKRRRALTLAERREVEELAKRLLSQYRQLRYLTDNQRPHTERLDLIGEGFWTIGRIRQLAGISGEWRDDDAPAVMPLHLYQDQLIEIQCVESGDTERRRLAWDQFWESFADSVLSSGAPEDATEASGDDGEETRQG